MRIIIRIIRRKAPRTFVIVGTILCATAGFLASYKISACLSFSRQTCQNTGESVGGISGLVAFIGLILCLLKENSENK